MMHGGWRSEPAGSVRHVRQLARGILVAGTILLVCAPSPARADGFVVPWVGSAFGQDPDNTGRLGAGAALGTMGGGGLFGFDIDFGYTPSFFGSESAVGENSVTTLMADLIAGPSLESSGGKGVRPYATFGVGLIHPKVGSGSDNNFGWNAAGGLMGFFGSRAGMRFDVCYFHAVDNTSVANTIQLKPGALHFWRVSAGVIMR